MKNLKYLTVGLFCVLLLACGGDDDANALPDTPTTQVINGTMNWSAFSPTSTNITNLVTIGGVNAAQHVTNAIPGDGITFQFNTGSKGVTKVTREIFWQDVQWYPVTTEDQAWLDWMADYSDRNNDDLSIYDSRDTNFISGFRIPVGAPTGVDMKFDMIVRIKEDGVLLSDQYLIDPKLKLRPSR